jgi:hypothetical protein
VVDVAPCPADLAVVEQHRTITHLTLKPLSQAALALGPLCPSPNGLGIVGEELDYACKSSPPSVNSLLSPSMALLVLLTCRPTGLTDRDRTLRPVRSVLRAGLVPR